MIHAVSVSTNVSTIDLTADSTAGFATDSRYHSLYLAAEFTVYEKVYLIFDRLNRKLTASSIMITNDLKLYRVHWKP